MKRCKQCKNDITDKERAENKRFCEECLDIRRTVSNHKYYLKKREKTKSVKYNVHAAELSYVARQEEMKNGKKSYIQ